MPYAHHVVPALIRIGQRREAAEVLKRAYVDARCSITDAASAMKCGRRAFLLWARELGLEEWFRTTAKLARLEGWHHVKVGGAGRHRGDMWETRRRNARSRGSETRSDG